MLRKFILPILVIFTVSLSYAQEGEAVLTDEEAIIQTINDETKAFYERDLEKVLNLWAHKDYISHSYMNIENWASFEKLVTMHIKNNPDPIENHEMNRENFKVIISGDMALVTFDQENPAVNGMEPQQLRGERTLEREDGIWKLVQVSSFNKAQSMDVAISGSELLDKTIAYHDPNGSWDKYSGKMNIVTARAGGKASNEVLELRNAENFYQTTMNGANGDKIIKRYDDGEYYAELNGNADLSEEEKNKVGLNEESLGFIHWLHLSHFGMPMAWNQAGLEVNEEVMMVNRNGNQYLQLEFYSNKDKAVSSLFDFQKSYLYIDPITKSLKGFYMKNAAAEYESWFTGELDVNGLKVPQVKPVWKDGEYFLTDSFSNVVVPE